MSDAWLAAKRRPVNSLTIMVSRRHDDCHTAYCTTQVDEIPLSRPKRNIARDFSDGGTCGLADQHARPKRPAYATFVLQQGAPCTPQSAGMMTVLFFLACSAGGRDCEEFPAASRGVAQLQVGMPAVRCRVDGQPWQLLALSAGERSVSQPARAAGAAPPTAWRRSCTTGRRSTRRCACCALMAGPLASEAPTASAALPSTAKSAPCTSCNWHAVVAPLSQP